MPVKSFKHKRLKRLFESGDARGLPAAQLPRLEDMLLALDTAETALQTALFPGWKLHQLQGDLEGYWSLTVSRNWRLIFKFHNGDAYDLDLVDYH